MPIFFAVVALLPRRLLPFVALTWIVRETVELGLKCRQPLIFLLETLLFLFQCGTEGLDRMISVLVVKGAGESHELVTLDVLELQIVLRTLDGIVGVFQRDHGVRIHEVGQVSAFAHAAVSFPTLDNLWMWHWHRIVCRNSHSVTVSLKFAVKVLSKRSKF